MKVFVVGANGQIGRHLIQKLKRNEEHTPKAMVRNEEQSLQLKNEGIETVIANLEDTVETIADAVKGCDAIVFTAGSGGKTGADKTLLIDLDGAVKTMEAAEKVGIKRFIIVSALQAHHRENWNESIKPYYVAKHYADRVLVSSDLDYTIIRPGGLLNEPGTGKVSIAENLQRGAISREDVAELIIACLNVKNTLRRSFDVVAGETPINVAIKQL
ncbi:SDR family oxidoreductase [Heyndrickxia oleronia]|uniref:SDR family oxidoreductase n=1 Tax=Heyndrickxia oleronia TaxID=38875 RepID=A0AAW6T4A3_9BACI|nr:SDR family oxidoreductase [Heyndrickxia oleronia]MDH5163101.1 SDR family oxidoreductase [Heyndrickxia oleronia]